MYIRDRHYFSLNKQAKVSVLAYFNALPVGQGSGPKETHRSDKDGSIPHWHVPKVESLQEWPDEGTFLKILDKNMTLEQLISNLQPR